MKRILLVAAAFAILATAANAQVQPGPNLYRGKPYIYAPNTGYVGPAAPVITPRVRESMQRAAVTGNGCAGFGKNIVNSVELIAEDFNVKNAHDKVNSVDDAFGAVVKIMQDALFERYQQLYKQNKHLEPVSADNFIPGADIRSALQKLDYERRKNCFPQFTKWLDDHSAYVAAREAEARRKAEEAAREAERRREAEAREAAKPQNRMFRAYNLYVRVKFCNEARQGYLIQYVNDAELDRATIAVKAIVRKAQEAEPGMDSNEIWEKARRAADGSIASQSYCQMYLSQLVNMSPVDTYNIQKP
jgi:hypothetical protein